MKRKAVFLDRDGTINIDRGFIHRAEEFDFVEGAERLIRTLNDAGFLVVVVTNQSGVARGFYSEDDVMKLHAFIEDELQKAGAHIDRFYFCPHHPEAPLLQYKTDCACRKPKPGMVLRALDDLGIDPKKSYMVGDSARDICAGKRAGLTSIRISGDADPLDTTSCEEKPDLVVKSLEEAVSYITQHE
jgi:D-glycero-D-manno-heptose 1,7-bisphosphate phosphatase